MDDNDRIGFQRCRTCGRWHPVAGAHQGQYCSRECARTYRRCPVCGEYFEMDESTSDGFCSAECAGVDGRDRPEDVTELEEEPEDVGDTNETE